MSCKTVIYPGTFDPVTNGHLDIIQRAAAMFDNVVVAVSSSKDKTPMFSTDDRVAMLREIVADLDGVTVEGFDSLLVDFVRKKGSKIIVRGLRAVSDFEYELQMGYANESLDSEIETVYLMPSLRYAFISSSVVRSILRYDGDIGHLVPETVKRYIQANGGSCPLPL